MGAITSPKFISLDTYVLGNLIKDYYSDERSENANEVLKYLDENGYIIFLFWHHFEELLQHQNDSVARERLKFISSRNHIAWFASTNSEFIGSIIDIHKSEMSQLLENSCKEPIEIIRTAKQALLKFGTGRDIVGDVETFGYIIDSIRNKVKSNRIIASLASFAPIDDNVILSSDKLQITSPEERQRRIPELKEMLRKHLEKHGDKRLDANEFDSIVDEFLNVVTEKAETVLAKGGGVEDLLQVGMNNYIPDNLTEKERGYKMIFIEKCLTIFSRDTSMLHEMIELDEKCPSWMLWRSLNEIHTMNERSDGGDINDKYLSALAYYLDVLIVDKRFNHYFHRLHDFRFKDLLCRVECVSNYEDLPKLLADPIA